MSGGLTAAGLLVLLLALIGLVVGLYYAYVCFNARPLRPKHLPHDSERGPLIPPDHNGNHEDVALEASAPEDDKKDDVIGKDVDLDTKLNAPSEPPSAPLEKSDRPLEDKPSASTKPSAPEDDSRAPQDLPPKNVLVAIEDDVPPANVVVERETPASNAVVVPHPPPKTNPNNSQNSPSSTSPRVSPVYIPVPLVKKPVVLSDEEDGLLLHECLPNEDDSLEVHDDTLPMSKTAAHAPEVNTPSKSEQPKEMSVEESPVPEPETELADEKLETPPTAPVLDVPIVVAASSLPDPSYGWKEELKPVNKAPDSAPEDINSAPSDVNSPTHLPMKEEEEQLHPIVDSSLLQPISDPKPLPPREEHKEESVGDDLSIPSADLTKPGEVKPLSEAKDDVEDVKPVSEPKDEVTEEPVKAVELPVKCKDVSEVYAEPLTDSDSEEEPPVTENTITPVEVKQPLYTQPLEKKEDVEEEYLPDEPKDEEKDKLGSNKSLSSEEALPPYSSTSASPIEVNDSTPVMDDVPEEEERSREVPAPVAVNPDETSTDSHTQENDPPSTNTQEEPDKTPVDVMKEDESEDSYSLSEISREDLVESSEAVRDMSPHLGVVEDVVKDEEEQLSESLETQPPSDKPSESSLDQTPEVQEETSTTNSVPSIQKNPVDSQPDSQHNSESKAAATPESTHVMPVKYDEPLDAYIPDSDEEFEGDGTSPLPVITEEAVSDSDSYTDETESSEPEVTEYSFSSGPSFPGASVILADEVSCTLEPKMTKISAIGDAEGSDSGDTSGSEEGVDEEENKSPLTDKVATDGGTSKPRNTEAAKTETDSSTSIPSAVTLLSNQTPNESIDSSSSPKTNSTQDLSPPTSPKNSEEKEQKLELENTQENAQDNSASETESEGIQAESEIREETLKAPTLYNDINEPPAATKNSSHGDTNLTDPSHIGSLDSEGGEESHEDNDDFDSHSESDSDSPITANCDVKTSTPIKSKIPRLVTQNSSSNNSSNQS